jgi:hypothetical protein
MLFQKVEATEKVIIMDAITNKIIEDTIVDVKFSGVSWKGKRRFLLFQL